MTNQVDTTWITAAYTAIQVVLYYIHERAWNKTNWGKESDPRRFQRLSGAKLAFPIHL